MVSAAVPCTLKLTLYYKIVSINFIYSMVSATATHTLILTNQFITKPRHLILFIYHCLKIHTHKNVLLIFCILLRSENVLD